jgi:pimeloyl-ACP methyl ester carboxylesterase
VGIPITFTYQNNTIAYYRFGQGNKPVVCLHGYGLAGNHFEFLENFLGNNYTLYCIDFPFHGQTVWNDGLAFTPADMEACIFTMLGKQMPFTILAYSMGGRVALQLLHTLPQYIMGMLLIAPDGLHKNKWQWFATHTSLGNKLFKTTMHNPKWVLQLLDVAATVGLVNKSIEKFVLHYLHDVDERKILYNRWTTMRFFKPHLPTVRRKIDEQGIKTHIVFGKYDRIILAKRGYAFKQQSANIVIHEIVAGHDLLKAKYAKQIAAYLLGE